jgi:hypothetical protein
LLRFAAAAVLSFVELSLAPTSTGMCVVAVECQPVYERFCDCARERIVEGIVELLTVGNEPGASAPRGAQQEAS